MQSTTSKIHLGFMDSYELGGLPYEVMHAEVYHGIQKHECVMWRWPALPNLPWAELMGSDLTSTVEQEHRDTSNASAEHALLQLVPLELTAM